MDDCGRTRARRASATRRACEAPRKETPAHPDSQTSSPARAQLACQKSAWWGRRQGWVRVGVAEWQRQRTRPAAAATHPSSPNSTHPPAPPQHAPHQHRTARIVAVTLTCPALAGWLRIGETRPGPQRRKDKPFREIAAAMSGHGARSLAAAARQVGSAPRNSTNSSGSPGSSVSIAAAWNKPCKSQASPPAATPSFCCRARLM